jgi:chemotaxis protein MotB
LARQRHAVHENHERWLVSYADFITLLFAFFVVMFASSQRDKVKSQAMSEAVKEAFEKNHVRASMAAILGGAADDRGRGNAQMRGPGGAVRAVASPPGAIVELMPSLKRLNEDLSKEIAAGKIEVSLQQRGLVVSLKQAAFFPSGTDAIEPGTFDSLEKVASVIRKLPNPVRLEGHTDSVPISTSRFRSNWELSAARSIALMELFANRFGVDRVQMAISGYADTVPVAPNTTEEGRKQNRRVDILILNEHGLMAEPSSAQPPSPPAESVPRKEGSKAAAL